jgi:hypothetical protein
MSHIHKEHKDTDGFVYGLLSAENAFGCKFPNKII